MNKRFQVLTVVLLALFIVSCKEEKKEDTKDSEVSTEETNRTPRILSYSFIKAWPHDTSSFTEGLLVHEGQLYESTGSPKEMPNTRSLFGVVNKQTGSIDVKVELDRGQYFGEGITFLKGKAYMLTYETKVGFVYDAKTFKKLGEFRFPNKEGWGMTTDSTYLIMSDGTSTLTYLDPGSFNVVKTLEVSDERGPVRYLNELEYIKGSIYANAFTTNTIVRIDPNTGKVAGKLDLTNLANQAMDKYHGSLEMNGIAYDPADNSIYFTGKMWPYIYQVTVSE